MHTNTHNLHAKEAFLNSSGMKSFLKAPFSWRISVDDGPEPRNKAVFKFFPQTVDRVLNKFYCARLIKYLIFQFNLARNKPSSAKKLLSYVFLAFRYLQPPSFPLGSWWVPYMCYGNRESSFLSHQTASARLSTPETGTSYARTDIVTWSNLAFPAKHTAS